MPVTRPEIPYSGVPSVTTQGGGEGGGDYSNARATPEAFGAGVGGAIEKAGETGVDLAMKQQGMINETEANNAEVNFIKQSGDIKNHYMQLEGIEADKARPQFEADLLQAHQNIRAGLNPMVQKAFDTTTTHQIALQSNEYSQYAAGQVKSANLSSFDAVGNTAVATAGNLGIVMDPVQSKHALDTITYTGNQIAGIHGDASLATGEDAKGNLTFPNTPEGQAAQARSMLYINAKKADWYVTAAKTVADNQGVSAAADWSKSHWDDMPDVAKVKMNQYLAPKMVNEDIDGAVASANLNMLANKDKQLLSNVPSSPTSQTPASSDLLGIIHKNEGFTGKIGMDSNGAQVINGVNERAFPQDYAVINAAYGKSKAEGDAATNDFYQKNILDKYDIKSLPANTQAIVADGLVNHTPDFAKSLIAAAKNGDTPQQLIDIRRAEYQRLATADTDGSHGWASSLKGWNNRLDSLEPQQQYSNDYERLTAERQPFIDSAVNSITEKRGSDLALIATTQKRAEANIDAQIRVAKGALDSDQKNVQGAIDGSLTKGQVPMTLEDLRSAPNVAPLLDKVQREQPEFYNSILTRIAKAQHSDATQNSPNAYDSILATMDQSRPYSRQERIEYLSKGLGSDNPGYSISQKDYNDAKPAVDLDSNIQGKLVDTMRQIANANGNVDGKGQQRAVQWYNNAMTAYKSMDQTKPDFIKNFTDDLNAPASLMPSRAQQLSDKAASIKGVQPVNTPSAKSADAPQIAVNPKTGEKIQLKDGKWQMM